MVEDEQYSCTSDMGVEVLVVITSFVIVMSVISLMISEFNPITRTRNSSHEPGTNLFLSSAYALFLPLMSYLFSQAMQYNPEGRSQVILFKMVLVEIIRIRADSIYTWGLKKSAEQLVRLLWVGFLVHSHTPLHGTSANLFALCVYFGISEVLKGIFFSKAKNSYLIGKNPKIIHNYMKRVLLHDNMHTTPMSSCDYVVMGEENHEITVCNDGYLLGEKKSGTRGILTVGRVFQLNSPEDEAFSSKHPYWRDTCLSLSLAKMLRRRFARLPLDETGCRKALDFVLEGLIDYIGNNQDILMDRNRSNEETNPTERTFVIISEEMKLVSEYITMKVPICHHFFWHRLVDAHSIIILICSGIYLTRKVVRKNSSWLSLVAHDVHSNCFFHIFGRSSAVKIIFSCLDLAITISLLFACIYIHYNGTLTVLSTERWSSLWFVKRYIKDPIKREKSMYTKLCKRFAKIMVQRKQRKRVNKAGDHCTVLDTKAETVLFCININVSILAQLPKWIRRNILRAYPTIYHSTDVKESILRFLRKSDGQLTNGETTLRNHGIAHLNWACRPNGSTTEAILIWHIATTLFHHQEFLSQQNSGHYQEPSNQQNTDFLKERGVALELSSYCHYLIVYLPELLPDEVEWTKHMHKRVIKDILAINGLSSDQKPTKLDRCNALWAKCGKSLVVGDRTSSVVEMGAKLAKDLKKCAEDGTPVWTVFADFWAEMMLFIAPSDNVQGHHKILYQEELITQLWVLLTHAGILTRPKAPENHDHDSHV